MKESGVDETRRLAARPLYSHGALTHAASMESIELHPVSRSNAALQSLRGAAGRCPAGGRCGIREQWPALLGAGLQSRKTPRRWHSRSRKNVERQVTPSLQEQHRTRSNTAPPGPGGAAGRCPGDERYRIQEPLGLHSLRRAFGAARRPRGSIRRALNYFSAALR